MTSTGPQHIARPAAAPSVNPHGGGPAYGRFPTPVADIVAAAGLAEAPATFLTESSIAAMPSHLHGALRRVGGKIHAVLDRKRRELYINPATDLAGQRAFKGLRETAHDLFPWQHIDGGALGYADNELTLSPRTTVLFEREANRALRNSWVAPPKIGSGVSAIVEKPQRHWHFGPTRTSDRTAVFASDDSLCITGEIVRVDGGIGVPMPIAKVEQAGGRRGLSRASRRPGPMMACTPHEVFRALDNADARAYTTPD